VIAIWVVAAIALVAGSHATGDQTSDNLTIPGSGSTNATDLLQAKLPHQAYGTNPVVLQAKSGTLTDSHNKKAIDDTVTSLKKAQHVIRAVSPLSGEGASALSKDKKIGYSSVTLDIGPSDLDKGTAQDIIDAEKPARDAGLEVATGGYLGQKVSKPETETSEVIGIAAAIIILLFAFGTATAMALPIVTAILGLLCALSIIRILGHATDVPTVAPTLATMIGLGVGIDYALFIVTRHKLQLRQGIEVQESVARATATAGGAVFFAGTTVVIALCSLGLAGIPLVRTLGFCAAIAVLVAVMAATTLLPALLGALGPRINSLRVQLGRTHPDDHQPHGWRRWAERVTSRPWPWVIVSTLFLLLLAVPVLSLQLGQNDVGADPKSDTTREAYDLITKGFGVGQNGPLLVAVKFGTPAKPDQSKIHQIDQQEAQLKQKQQQIVQQGLAAGLSQQQAQAQAQQKTSQQQAQLEAQKKQASSSASDPRLTKLQDDIKKTPGVKSVSPATTDKKADTAVFTAVATTSPSDEKTETLVNHLRDDVIPSATKGTDLTATIGGQTASYIDLAKKIADKLPSMIAIVVALSFVVLVLAFRSILIPVKAAVANLLSVGAAYGVLTAVFQKGWGATVIGLDGSIPIVSFVPLLMFAILFGLSMDYEVFLLTQIQDRFKHTGDARRAVVDGLASTGRVITSAALIMVCVFGSFILDGDPIVKEFGVGLAVAIAIDATVVRCMLVPAVMALMGRAAWWLPAWLGRLLPRISVEGEDYFAKRGQPRPAHASRV
jgi:RND superfamily putative drug exporter